MPSLPLEPDQEVSRSCLRNNLCLGRKRLIFDRSVPRHPPSDVGAYASNIPVLQAVSEGRASAFYYTRVDGDCQLFSYRADKSSMRNCVLSLRIRHRSEGRQTWTTR